MHRGVAAQIGQAVFLRVLIAETGPVTGRLRVREIDDDEGVRLVRIIRRAIRNFNADRFGSLYPKYKGGHPPKFTLGQRREIKKIAKSRPGVVDDISHEGLRALLRQEGVTFQRLKTCSPLMSWARTSCTVTSSRARPGPGSWSSAATCARCTRHPPASRSSATTSART
jgi:hypothetical protein